MDLNSILQGDKKKKFLIIGGIILFVLIVIVAVFSRSQTSNPTNGQTPDQTQLLNDISQLAPRDGVSQNPQNLVSPIVNVVADVPTVAPGQSSVITWTSNNATSCVDGNGNSLRLNGSMSITPQENYTLDVICTNPKGTTIQSVTVAVTTTPIITITASPLSVKSGEQSIISWTSLNTTRCTDDSGKTVRLSGTVTVAPQKPFTYGVNCSGPNGTAKKSITVGITASAATGASDKYIYIFRWKANGDPNTPFQTSTFQTSASCDAAQKSSSGFEKTACIRVAIGSTISDTTVTGTTSGSSSSQAAADEAAKLAAEIAAREAAAQKGGSGTGTGGNTGGGPGGNTGPITVTNPEPTGPKITASLDHARIGYNQISTLTWDVKDATSCTIKNDHIVSAYVEGGWVAIGAKSSGSTTGLTRPLPSMSGSIQLKLSGADNNVIFTIRCTGNGITNTAPDLVLYWDGALGTFDGPPDVQISADPTAVAEAAVNGGTGFSTVTWDTINATSCTVKADAYAELWTDSNGWQKIYSDAAPVAVETSGQVKIKPGYDGTSVPLHTETSSCQGSMSESCSPSSWQTGNGARLGSASLSFLGGSFSNANTAETVTVSCKGPIALTAANSKGGKIKSTNSVIVTITPTPSSGGGGGW